MGERKQPYTRNMETQSNYPIERLDFMMISTHWIAKI